MSTRISLPRPRNILPWHSFLALSVPHYDDGIINTEFNKIRYQFSVKMRKNEESLGKTCFDFDAVNGYYSSVNYDKILFFKNNIFNAWLLTHMKVRCQTEKKICFIIKHRQSKTKYQSFGPYHWHTIWGFKKSIHKCEYWLIYKYEYLTDRKTDWEIDIHIIVTERNKVCVHVLLWVCVLHLSLCKH